MPSGNDFVSKLRRLKIGDKIYLAQNFNRADSMDVEPAVLLDGTILPQILDIGGVREQIRVEAPILIGSGSAYDGRTLINEKIQEQMNFNFDLPIMSSASIQVQRRGGGSASIELLGDGIPNSDVFQVLGPQEADNILNPSHEDNIPTRKANWYDFAVSIGKYQFQIESLRLDMRYQSEELYFMNSLDAQGNVLNQDLPGGVRYPGNTYNFGTQFPWIAVKSMSMTGGGTAVVSLKDLDSDGDYEDDGEAVNVNLGEGGIHDLTLQRPGRVLHEANNFEILIFKPQNDTDPDAHNQDVSNGTWVPLFADITDSSIIDFRKGVITKSDFQVNANEVMRVNFEFTCWVGKPI